MDQLWATVRRGHGPLDDANEWGIVLLDAVLAWFDLDDPDSLSDPAHPERLEAIGDAAHGFALALADDEVKRAYRSGSIIERRCFRENIEWIIGGLATLSGSYARREITLLRETVQRINGFGFEALEPVLISQRHNRSGLVFTTILHASAPSVPTWSSTEALAFA